MNKLKVSDSQAFVFLCLCLLNFADYTFENLEIECIPLKLCPLAVKLVTTKKYAQSTIDFLKTTHCGFDGREPKVWCNKFSCCMTPNMQNGTCKHIKDCSTVQEIMLNVDTSKPEIRDYLQKFRCNTIYDSEVHVCCPNEEEYTSNTITPKKIFNRMLPNPELKECGVQNIDSKIVGGYETELEEFPWTALLKYDNIRKNKTAYACAGSLINKRYVLTAAHCVHPKEILKRGLVLRQVILGEYDTRNATDCIYNKYGVDCADDPVFYDIDYSSIIVHEKYGNMKNDIALIRLPRDVQFSEYISPICLPEFQETMTVNTTFVITGWGKTDNLEFSPIKRKASIRYSRSAKCHDLYSLTNGQICAGDGNGIDTCVGDSGGPMMYSRNTDSDTVTFIIGITSFGLTKCGFGPSVYTYVPRYIDWITNNIR